MAQNRLQNIGSLYKGKPDGKSIANGTIMLLGLPIRVVILPNRYKKKQNDPDYVVQSPGLDGGALLAMIENAQQYMRGGQGGGGWGDSSQQGPPPQQGPPAQGGGWGGQQGGGAPQGNPPPPTNEYPPEWG